MQDLRSVHKVVGLKQTQRALTEGAAKKVLVARDADARVTSPIVSLCSERGVPVEYTDTMRELGNACGIDVGAAMLALL